MLVIREITALDTDAVLEMMKDFYHSPACLHQVPEDNFRRTLKEVLGGNPDVRILVLEETGEDGSEGTGTLLGYAHFVVSWNNEAGGRQIWFDELYLKEEARGKGCGTRVFRWLEEHYPSVRRIRLEVTPDNTRAIDLYRRLGYQSLGYQQMYKDFT